MKLLSGDLQSHLDSGATTMCHCWLLVRHDGTRLGFTDHDLDLLVDGQLYEASAGFTASAVSASSGLAVDNLDVLGALSSSSLTDGELAAGLFDDAEIEIWRVNWTAPEQRMLLRKGNLGEVHRGSQGFSAEVRGLSHRLNQSTGRLFQYACDADLGDTRCGVELSGSAFSGTGTILEIEESNLLFVDGLQSYEQGWFSRGLFIITSGAASGEVLEIKSHQVRGGKVSVELWQRPAQSLDAGTAFSIRAGCDKQFATCRQKFSNATRFRGFPHLPGNDFAFSYPRRDGTNDGGSRQ